MAKSALPILFILIATATFTAARATIKLEPALAPSPALNFEEEDIMFTWGCASSVLEAKGCAADILKSFVTFNLKVSEECCDAIIDIGDKCFSVLGSGPFLYDFIKDNLCSHLSTPPSPPSSA